MIARDFGGLGSVNQAPRKAISSNIDGIGPPG